MTCNRDLALNINSAYFVSSSSLTYANVDTLVASLEEISSEQLHQLLSELRINLGKKPVDLYEILK